MAEKEYIISLKRGVDYTAFDDEMSAGYGRGLITDRIVDVANARPLSQRNTHYMLTEAEVVELLKDERVADIQIPPEDRDDIQIGTRATQTGTWRKTSATTASDLNWGMLRATTREDVWGNGVTDSTRPFNYNLTGKGVDVVIQDSGIDTGHIEFTDTNGVSRVKPIDWYSASGVSGTQNANHYRDYDGHGTHVASTVAGRTMGWAKDAHIYSIKISGLEGTGDSGTGISTSNCFDVIKGWHNNKPIDPATGYKRPTIVNMSWGYSSSISNTPTLGSFRGTAWTYGDAGFASDANLRDNAGILQKYYNSGVNRKINVRYTSIDTDIQELINAGIHVCIAAGNSYYYIAAEGDQDWNNYARMNGSNYYYHRGSSPYDTEAFMVGSLDVSYTSGKEQKSEFSCCGPGVDIYAAGNNIMGASSDDSAGTNDMVSEDSYTRVAHPLNSGQWLMKVSGTSMASPNVCGMLATVLEANPNMSVSGLKEWAHTNSTKDAMYQGIVDNWDDHDSINCGGSSDYESTAIVTSTEYAPLAKEMDVRGLKLLAWGAKGGAQAVSDSFIEKVARHVEMMLDPTGTDVDATAQAAAIAGMKSQNTVQFIGHTSGSYDPSILSDDANDYYPGLGIIRNMYSNVDFVWQSDDSAGSYVADNQIMEIMEHVLHTLTVYALPAAYPTQFNQANQTSALYDACAQAITNNVYDVSSYGSWPGSDPDIRALIMREYYYLLTLSMWDYFSFVDGGSLSPEWNDNSRTPSGIQTNNSLGYALYNDYGKKVLTKPSETVLDSMHATSGPSGWVPNANTNRIIYTPYATANTFTTSVPVGVST
jgi:subtilisin family serine protease